MSALIVVGGFFAALFKALFKPGLALIKELFKAVLRFIVQDRLRAWMPRIVWHARRLAIRLGLAAPGVPVAFKVTINTTLPRLRVQGQGLVSQGPS